MNKKISRREALKLGVVGVLGGLAACSPAAQATESLLSTASPFPLSTSTPAPTSLPGADAGN